MKQILIATDFSSGSANAMEYALELAKVLQQEVCVLHAVGSMEGVNNNTYNALYIDEYQNSKREALTRPGPLSSRNKPGSPGSPFPQRWR